MNIYIILAFALLVTVSILYNLLSQRVRYLAREHRELIALIFHQVHDLLTSIRWHTELIKNKEFKLAKLELMMIRKIEDGIDNALIVHRRFLVSSDKGTKDPKEKGPVKKDPKKEANLHIVNRDEMGDIKFIFHELLDLLTAIKWQTELLVRHAEGGPESPRLDLLKNIDKGVDETINLIDRFLRISANQKHLSQQKALRILQSNIGSFLSPEQKETLDLPNVKTA